MNAVLKSQSWAEERKTLLALFGMEDLPELLIEIAVVRVCRGGEKEMMLVWCAGNKLTA